MNGKIKYSIMNGKLLRFRLKNGKRVWIDLPSDEWQRQYKHNQTNHQTNLFTKP